MDFTRTLWPVSLLVGAKAALDSGAQGGIAGETAYSDFLLAFDIGQQSLQQSGENVFIGFDTPWSRMILKTLCSRHLSYSCLLWKDDQDSLLGVPSHSCCRNGCAKVKKPDGGIKVLPNMFYGLVDATPLTNDIDSHTVVHRPECILHMTIHERSTEFLTANLHDRLQGITIREGLVFCLKLINFATTELMKLQAANYWDKRIMVRIQALVKMMSEESTYLDRDIGRSDFLKNEEIERWKREDMEPHDAEMNDTIKNEVIDRVFTRVQDMFERLDLNKFLLDDDAVSLDGAQKKVYSANDVCRAFIFCFGTMRAVIMSEHIFQDKGLVLMGYNIAVGTEIVRDLSQVPRQDQVGYAPRFQGSDTSGQRLFDTTIDDNHVFFGLALDAALSTGIAVLTGLGPTLSMYVAHSLTARYRESTLRMGTSMSWAVSRVQLYNTGTARDDWMACILPARRPNTNITFKLIAAIAVAGPVAAWLIYQHPVGPINNLGKLICIFSALSGITWTWTVNSMYKDKNLTATKTAFCSVSFFLLFLLLNADMSQALFYGLEIFYAFQWIYGEYSGEWLHRSASIFALGILGALRINSMTESVVSDSFPI